MFLYYTQNAVRVRANPRISVRFMNDKVSFDYGVKKTKNLKQKFAIKSEDRDAFVLRFD
jgi:hypothetical protein